MSDWTWWRDGVVYQIYPRSFQDANGDGVGDLEGIRRRLDHLAWLGVDAIWLSPIYPSPMADFGYDVADFTGIHPLFGTLEEFVEQLTWSQLEQHQKPIVLANIGGYWGPLLMQFERMRNEGFIRRGLELHLEMVDEVDAIIPAITRVLVPRGEAAEAEEEAKVTAKF